MSGVGTLPHYDKGVAQRFIVHKPPELALQREKRVYHPLQGCQWRGSENAQKGGLESDPLQEGVWMGGGFLYTTMSTLSPSLGRSLWRWKVGCLTRKLVNFGDPLLFFLFLPSSSFHGESFAVGPRLNSQRIEQPSPAGAEKGCLERIFSNPLHYYPCFSSNLAETGVKLRDAATSDLDERTETQERRGQRRRDEDRSGLESEEGERKEGRKRRKL